MRAYSLELGDVRERCGFLLMPRTIGGETRWLEWAKWEEVWTNIGRDEVYNTWIESRWINE